MSGEFDLGDAEGRVRIIYESTGHEKALAQMQEFQRTTYQNSKEWTNWGKGIESHSDSLAKMEKLQKAYNDAVKVAVAAEGTLAAAKRNPNAGFKDTFNASKNATLAQRSVQDLAKVLAKVNKQIEIDMAREGSTAAQAFADSFQKTGVSRGSSAAHSIGIALTSGLGLAAKGAATAAAGAAMAAGVVVGGVMMKGVARSVQLDTVQHKLMATGRSAEQVKGIMNSVRDAVHNTEYSLGEAGEAAASALNAGIKPGKDLTEYLKLIADTATASGRSFGSVASILDGIRVNNRANLDDIRRLGDSGIDIWTKLSETLGVSRSKLQEMVSDSKIGSKEVEAALRASVGGMSGEMGKSVVSLSKNIMNSVARIGEALIAPAFGEAGGFLDTVLNALKSFEAWLSQNKEGIIDFWADMGAVALSTAHVFMDVVSFISDAVVKVTEIIGDLGGWAVQLWGGINRLIGRSEVADDLERTAQQLHNLGTGLRENRDGNLSAVFAAIDRGANSLDKWRDKAKRAAREGDSIGDASEEAAEKVVSLSEALEEMGVKNKDVVKGIEGTTEQFKELLKALKDKGATDTLLNKVSDLRNRFQNGGEAVRGFAKAIDSLADSTEDASAKSENLIKYLKKLNIIPDDDAIEKYNDEFRKLTDLQPDLVDQLEATGSALINLDGTINTTSKNGKVLKYGFDEMVDAAMALAASGKADLGQVWDSSAAGLKLFLQQFGVLGQEADNLIAKRLLPKDAFIKMFQSAGDPQSALNAVIKDPLKLQTAIDLEKNTTQKMLDQITGPDGSFHVPTVLDVDPSGLPGGKNPEKQPERIVPTGPPVGPKFGPPIPFADFLSDAVSKAIARHPDRDFSKTPGGSPSGNNIWPGDPLTGQKWKYAEKVENPQVNLGNNDVVGAILAQLPSAPEALGKTYEDYKKQGKTLADAYADGILTGDEEVRKAISYIAQIAGDGLGNSPAKYGPLSGSGWTFNRGQKFTVAFAEGIGSQVDSVKSSSSTVAGGAVAPINETFEKWLKDMSEFSGIGKRLKDFADQVSQIFMSAAQLGNQLSGGRLFPKNYVKDPALAAKAQQKALRDNALRSQGLNPDNLFGMGTGANPGGLNFSGASVSAGDLSNPAGIAQYIYAKARAAGYSHEMANDFIIQAAGESGFNPNANGGNQDGTGAVRGIFQFTPGTWADFGNGGDMTNAKDNIDAYFRLAAARGPNINNPEQIGTQISIGGPWHPQNQAKGHLANAKATAAPYLVPDSMANNPALLVSPNAIPYQQPQQQPQPEQKPTETVAPQQQSETRPAPKDGSQKSKYGIPLNKFTRPEWYGSNTSLNKDGVQIGPYGLESKGTGHLVIMDNGRYRYANPEDYNPWAKNESKPKPKIVVPETDDSIFGTIYGKTPTKTGGAQPIPLPKNDPNELPVRSADEYGGVARKDHETPLKPEDNPERITPQQVSQPKEPIVLPALRDTSQLGPYGLDPQKNIEYGQGGFPDWVYALGKTFGLQASTYPGHQVDKAGTNQGIDWVGSPEMLDKFAMWLGTQPGVAQVIWNNVNTGIKYGFADGQRVGPGTNQPGYYRDDWGNHANHLHTRFTSGVAAPGWVPDAASLAGNTQGGLPVNITGVSPLAATQFGLPGLLDQMASNDANLAGIMRGARAGFGSDDEAISALRDLDNRIADANNLNTPQSKAMATELGTIRSGIMARQGLTEGQDTLSTVSQIGSAASGMAGDVFSLIDDTINSIGGAKQISGTLVRGIENTKDINDMVDSIQTFIQLATTIGQTVTDGLGMASMITGMAGAGDTSGGAQGAAAALGAASSIAGIVTSVISAVNAGIDLAQEAYALGTKYLGRMLVNLFGMPDASDINYLLDTVTGQLKIYSSDNPDYKTTFNTIDRQIFGQGGERTQPQNTFYIYQGPGQDPRDTMNDAMFAVRSSGTGVFGYDS